MEGLIIALSHTYGESRRKSPENYTIFVPISDGQPPASSDRQYTIDGDSWSVVSGILTRILDPDPDPSCPSGFSANNMTNILKYAQNIGQVVDALATAMSSQIRQTKGSTQFAGQAWRIEAFYYVRWRFYVFDAAFALLGIAFTAWAILWSERAQVHAWKSSSLPLLFAELDGWDRTPEFVVASRTPQGLKAAAERMRGGVVDASEPLNIERAF